MRDEKKTNMYSYPKAPLLSVIIPVYNAQDVVYDLLEDVRNQTFTNIEVIMVNDGSTDNSGEICKEFAEKDSRFIYLYQENSGVSDARNYGISIAAGYYIAFLDADDRIPLNRFEIMIKIMEDDKTIDLLLSRYAVKVEKGEFPYSLWQSEASGKQSAEKLIMDFARSMTSFYYGAIWNKLYKRDIMEKYNIRFEKSVSWGEDLLFNLRYFEHVEYCYFMTEETYYYCYTDGSLLSDTSIYEPQIDFIRYDRIIELGERLEDEQVHAAYVKEADRLLLNQITRRMSLKASGKKSNDVAYQEFKDYIQAPEVMAFWEDEDNDRYKNVRVFRLIHKLTKKRQYRLVFHLFRLKEKLKKNRVNGVLFKLFK